MAKSVVFVEIDPKTEKIIRIFKNNHKAFGFDQSVIRQSLRNYAVSEIRQQIVERSKIAGIPTCEWCGIDLPGELNGRGLKGHMHEKQFKGKGGEVSLENGVMLCPTCHFKDDDAHGDRKWGG